MPCDYRILQSPTKEQVKLILLETVRRSHNREGLYQLFLVQPLLVALEQGKRIKIHSNWECRRHDTPA